MDTSDTKITPPRDGVLASVDCLFDAVQQTLEQAIKQRTLLPDIVSRIIGSDQTYCLGVGKMAFASHKFAASLRSIGIGAHHLDATHLAHGDLGVLRKNSVSVIFSKSGNSAELKAIAPFLKKHSSWLVLITNKQESPLASFADTILSLHCEHEGDGFNVLPLASTVSAIVLADAIVAATAHSIDFNPEKFGLFHPAGQIGLNLNRKVGELPNWRKRTPFIDANASVAATMKAIGRSLCGLACVVDEDSYLIGIVSDGDLRRGLVENAFAIASPVASLINRNPLIADVNDDASEVYRSMEGGVRKVTALPVIHDTKCVGVLTIHDLF